MNMSVKMASSLNSRVFLLFFLSCYLITLSTEQVNKKDLDYHHMVFVGTSVTLLRQRFFLCVQGVIVAITKSYKGDTHGVRWGKLRIGTI